LPGRYIFEGVVVLHETIHELKRKKRKALLSSYTLRRPMIRLIRTSCSKSLG
jgi:hypothetical protein